ncbi:hypothetical protein D3C80_793690 [compost metagenome]
MVAPCGRARARVQDPEAEHQGGVDRRAPGRSCPALHPVCRPARRGGLGAGAHPATGHEQAAAGCLGSPGQPSAPVQRQGAEAATGHQRPLAAGGRHRAGHERRFEPGRCGARGAHSAACPGSVAAHLDPAGPAGQTACAGIHSAAASGRARRAATHPGRHSRAALAQPGRGAQWQCRVDPLARSALGPAGLAGWSAAGPAGDPGGGAAAVAPWQGGGHSAPGRQGLSLLATGSGRREGRGPVAAQPAAHRSAGQRMEAGR